MVSTDGQQALPKEAATNELEPNRNNRTLYRVMKKDSIGFRPNQNAFFFVFIAAD